MKHIKYFFLSLICCLCIVAQKPKLLIKIPTRARPHQFFRNLDKFYQNLSYKIPYQFLITCDIDDTTMNNPHIIKRLKNYPHLEFTFSDNKSKVEAFNKDLDRVPFDIILAAHDDMEVLVKGFDKIIVDTMLENFPDLDGVLNFNDGFVGEQCNTLPVIGKTFYNRFGYIYNPDYQALVCNVELTLICKILKKEKVIDQVIIRHNHPAWKAGSHDNLYARNEHYHKQDLELFYRRRSRLFDLSNHELSQATPLLWSILICTIEGREESFTRVTQKIKNQIDALNLNDKIEILYCKDMQGQHSIGYKRNQLLEQSSGEYVSFVDDDDDVHDDFIKMIYQELQHKPDCVSLTGIITCNGTNAKKFIHSINHKEYFEYNNTYFRPPNHLNPIKRSIAIQFRFPEKNFGEDTQWALEIAQSGLLQKEELIDIPYYFYLYKDK